MKRIYGFFLAHSRLVVGAALAVATAEAGFIFWQHSLQEEILSRITSPAGLAEFVVVSSTPGDSSFFERRDRLHVVVASTIYSNDPAAAPLSLEFDVVANFGPFGLTGDVYPLNTTADTATLLKNLAGTHPRLSIRFRWALFAKELQVTATAAPFDMQMDADLPGIGPTSWRGAAKRPVTLRAVMPRAGEIKARVEAPDFMLTFTDPAANIMRLTLDEAELTTRARVRGVKDDEDPDRFGTGPDWFLETARLNAGRARVEAGDWRGLLTVDLRSPVSEMRQTPAVRASRLEGAYEAHAERLTAAVKSVHAQYDRLVEGRDFALKLRASNVPTELFTSGLDDTGLTDLIKGAGAMHFALDDLSFNAVGCGRTSFAAELDVGGAERRSGGAAKTPKTAVSWRLAAEMPQKVVDLADVIIHGARADLRSLSLADLMERRAQKPGAAPVYTLRMAGDNNDLFILRPAKTASAMAPEGADGVSAAAEGAPETPPAAAPETAGAPAAEASAQGASESLTQTGP